MEEIITTPFKERSAWGFSGLLWLGQGWHLFSVKEQEKMGVVTIIDIYESCLQTEDFTLPLEQLD